MSFVTEGGFRLVGKDHTAVSWLDTQWVCTAPPSIGLKGVGGWVGVFGEGVSPPPPQPLEPPLGGGG